MTADFNNSDKSHEYTMRFAQLTLFTHTFSQWKQFNNRHDTITLAAHAKTKEKGCSSVDVVPRQQSQGKIVYVQS